MNQKVSVGCMRYISGCSQVVSRVVRSIIHESEGLRGMYASSGCPSGSTPEPIRG